MNENKKNEEIEVLDGLEDFFDSLPEETDVKENRPVESAFEDEVLSVLDEPESDPYFSDFQPDVIEETSENVDLPEVVSDDLTPTIEPVLEPEVFSMEEPVVEIPVEVSDTPEETPDVEEIEPEFGLGFESSSMMSDFTDIGPDSLEPIEITSPIEPELSDMNEMFQMNFEEPKEVTEPIESVQEEVTPEIPNETIDYNFMEEFAPQTNNTLEDAFQFGTVEPVEEPATVKEESYDSDALGKTVVIEPVEPKEVQSVPEKEEQPEEESLALEEVPEEKKETKKAKKKKEKKKNNGRTILFVLLLSILLLAFVALMPMLLETFAV